MDDVLQLFISYARNDEAFVSPLRLMLKQSGYNVWVDRRSIKAGEEWAKEIEHGIQSSDVLLVCCSQASMQSQWVRKEVDLALESGLKVIPLLVEKVPLMPQVAHLHWIDFTAIGYYEEEFDKLTEALKGHVEHRRRAETAESSGAKVFLSYKHGSEDDEQLAAALESALLATGCDVFLDDQVIQMGTRGAERVIGAIQDSDFMIMLLSDANVESEVVAVEVQRAAECIPQYGLKLLPVRVGLRGDFPYRIRQVLDPLPWAFWSGQTETPALITAIQAALKGKPLPVQSIAQKAELLREPDYSAHITAPQPYVDPGEQIRRFEQPTGTVNPASRYYVERACDGVMREHLSYVGQGATVVVKAPRQMGKSSLMMQGIKHARDAGKRIAYMDFQMLDNAVLHDESLFYKGFCQWIVEQLGLHDTVPPIDKFWMPMLAKPMLCTQYLAKHVLPALDGDQLVLAIDEVDRVFTAQFSAGFFGMLRSWHNNRSFEPTWQRLDLVLIISTEPYLLIDNPHQSPFNVGELLTLDDFTPEQVAELNQRHGAPLSAAEVTDLLALIGGHPYLTREALYQVGMKRLTLTDIFEQAMNNKGPFADHLMHYMFLLNDHPELEESMLAVINRDTPPPKEHLNRLHSAGLVRLIDGGAIPRCALYADYFHKQLSR